MGKSKKVIKKGNFLTQSKNVIKRKDGGETGRDFSERKILSCSTVIGIYELQREHLFACGSVVFGVIATG